VEVGSLLGAPERVLELLVCAVAAVIVGLPPGAGPTVAVRPSGGGLTAGSRWSRKAYRDS
jgi:hypothetical protein